MDMATTIKLIQMLASGGVLVSSVLIFIVMVVHITRFESRFARVEVKLGLRAANGDAEEYGKVVTVGDLMKFEARQMGAVEQQIARCRAEHLTTLKGEPYV